MSSKIDITINGVPLEVEIDGEAPEPSNGLQGGFDIIALRAEKDRDIWPVVGKMLGVEELILSAIERESENRREP